ncbi:STAS domain-containing protein [Streptomyces sp. NPDC008139]|uniref:STAS domain-containing protein n=1 Tax=Streptomyces sp. NPDC008139 TaxID=3364814 RepID=UPI0036E17A39
MDATAPFTCPTALGDDGTLTLRPCGDIDLEAHAALTRAQLALRPGLRGVHLDFDAVPFMDTTALRFLSSLHARCTAFALPLHITGLRPQHRRMLSLSDYRLPTSPTSPTTTA